MTAVVDVDEITLAAGEQWTTRPDTGWFHRYLPGGGTYSVRVSLDETEVVREITADSGVTTLEVAL